jgi:hypothetical protein
MSSSIADHLLSYPGSSFQILLKSSFTIILTIWRYINYAADQVITRGMWGMYSFAYTETFQCPETKYNFEIGTY